MDLVRFFPHIFWVSNWAKDGQFPAGFRYKLLSVRDEKENKIELVTVMEEPGGIKTERDRITFSPLSAFERLAPGYVAKLEEAFGIKFERLDLTDIRSEADWEERCREEGFRNWEYSPPN